MQCKQHLASRLSKYAAHFRDLQLGMGFSKVQKLRIDAADPASFINFQGRWLRISRLQAAHARHVNGPGRKTECARFRAICHKERPITSPSWMEIRLSSVRCFAMIVYPPSKE